MKFRHAPFVMAIFLVLATTGQVFAGLCGLAGHMLRRHGLHGCGSCDPGCEVQCYTVMRTATRTVYDTVTETRYRTVYDVSYEHKVIQGVDRIPVVHYEDRPYTIHRPLVETLTKEVPYTVTWPVYETMSREVHYVTHVPTYETKTTQIPYTTYHPVTETHSRTVHYSVPRTIHYTQTIPIHSGRWDYRTEEQPGPVLQRCVQDPGCWKWDPCCCRCVYVPGPCRIVQVQCPPIKVCKRVWIPIVSQREIACSKVVYDTQSKVVPYTSTRMVPQTHTRPITYTMTRMMPITQSRTIQYQVARMMSEQRVKTVAYPVTRMVPETAVQTVPVTSYREVPTSSTICVPTSIPRTVSYTVTRCVPRTECYQVPVRICVAVPRCPADPGCCDDGCDASNCDQTPALEAETDGEPAELAPVPAQEASHRRVALQRGDANPEEASRAFVSGLSHLWSQHTTEAIGQFRAARDADAAHPKYAYFLALAQRQAGQTEQAEASLAEAIELERVAPLAQWGQLMQRVQGNDRLWIEKARKNAGL